MYKGKSGVSAPKGRAKRPAKGQWLNPRSGTGHAAASRGATNKAPSRKEVAEDRGRKPAPPPQPVDARPRLAGLEGGSVWLWGVHPALSGLANPDRRCRRLLLTAEAEKNLADRLREAEAKSGRRLPGIERVDRADLDRLLPRDALHQGVAVVALPLEEPDLDDLLRRAEAQDKAVLVLLDQVSDPHNVGAVLRSAAAFGALGVVMTARHSPEETGTLAKSASGALDIVPLVRVVNLSRAMTDIKDAGFTLLGLDAHGQSSLAEAKRGAKVALVLGAEGKGLRQLTRQTCDGLAHLPMSGAIDSLNVSNAAAVALYEMVRIK